MSSSATAKESKAASAIRAAWQDDPDVARRYAIAERATRPFAAMMVQLARELAPPSLTHKEGDSVDVFDLGCGTGAVEAEVYGALGSGSGTDGVRILAGDVSAPMLSYLSARAADEGWAGVDVQTVDGTRLADAPALQGRAFDAVYVGFAIFMLPPAAPAQLAALLKPRGSLAVSSWAILPWFPLLAEAYARMHDGPPPPVQRDVWSAVTNGLPWHDKAFVRETLQQAGLEQVTVRQEKVSVDVGDADTVMGSMGFVLGILSQQWPEEKREAWLADAKRAFREVVVESERGEGEGMEWVFEGIVGVGVKPE
ncbi:hypothetical protein B5807_02489 [Epicoccum nigrum]|uniref:Methyltransferase domain-containing protein n=1 Tax=Epicoccum nigrum TaxID=105696 RepID=A0A1Y2M9Z3_EPING|nr:hypothetical protein B5807_02489 [Epicoccum nigrum]